MKKITCEKCGSNDIVMQEGLFVCQGCGCKYTREEVKEMTAEETVEVTEIVHAENPTRKRNPRAAAHQAKKRNTKAIIITALLVIVCVAALFLLLTASGGPEGTYKRAQDLLSKGKYTEAAEKFESLGSYEDATTLTMYCKACALCESGDFETGIAALKKLGDYKDCSYRITYYTARSWDDPSVGTTEFELMERAWNIYSENPLYLDSNERMSALDERANAVKEKLYGDALATAESGEYRSAIITFKRLGSYSDSAQRARYYNIRWAEESLNGSIRQDDWVEVAEDYTKLNNFLDSADQALAAMAQADQIVADKYARVSALMQEGKYADADTLLASFGSYGNYDVKKNYYAVAEGYLATRQWEASSKAFSKAGNYSDAKERINQPYYVHAEQLLVEGKWDEAIAAYKKANKYSDAASRIVYCGYRKQEDALATTNDQDALTALAAKYAEMGEYLDSADRAAALEARAIAVLDSKYDTAVALMNEGKYSEAQMVFDGIADRKDSVKRKTYCQARVMEPTAMGDSGLKQVQKLYESISDFEDSETRAKRLYHQRIINYPDKMSNFSEGLAAVKKNGRWGYVDKTGKVVSEPQWDDASSFSEGLAAVERNDYWGYIDKTGKVVIEPQWDRAYSFSDGLAEVKKNGKWGYIDKTGKVVNEPQWDEISEAFYELPKIKKNGKYGFIDKTGKVVSEPQWDDTLYFSEGLVAVEKNGKWGFIDKTGKVVSEPQWNLAKDFSEGLAAVKKNGYWGYIDKTGKVVIERQWDDAGVFSEGLAAVARNDYWGYIDKTGKVVIEPQWDRTYSFSDGLAKVWMKRWGWGFIDKTGKVVSEPQWDGAADFSEGLAYVEKNGKYGYIDKTGKVVSEPQWDKAYSFREEGLATVKKNGKWGYIDKTGKVVIEPQWDDAHGFIKGLAYVEKNGKCSLIDTQGNVVFGWR